ncbi:MAG TPA: multidrug transporter [Candidatus Nanoarchaeia archaeon]|nr:multidrug transporter [Candidatus Nanoarchaeia archaeon]
MSTPLWSMGVVLVATFIGAFGALMLKKASATLSLNVSALLHNHHLREGVALYGIGTLLFIPALRAGELSVLYPFVATVYIWTSILSLLFLQERMNLWKVMGVLGIIIGVTFIGVGSAYG